MDFGSKIVTSDFLTDVFGIPTNLSSGRLITYDLLSSLDSDYSFSSSSEGDRLVTMSDLVLDHAGVGNFNTVKIDVNADTCEIGDVFVNRTVDASRDLQNVIIRLTYVPAGISNSCQVFEITGSDIREGNTVWSTTEGIAISSVNYVRVYVDLVTINIPNTNSEKREEQTYFWSYYYNNNILTITGNSTEYQFIFYENVQMPDLQY